jgi:hypothetical protein
MLANFYLIIFPREINGYQQIPAVSAHPPIQLHPFAPIYDQPSPAPNQTILHETTPTTPRIIGTVRESPNINATTIQSFTTSYGSALRNPCE